jgi:hypothetical protein
MNLSARFSECCYNIKQKLFLQGKLSVSTSYLIGLSILLWKFEELFYNENIEIKYVVENKRREPVFLLIHEKKNDVTGVVFIDDT